MKRTIRFTESELINVIERIVSEQTTHGRAKGMPVTKDLMKKNISDEQLKEMMFKDLLTVNDMIFQEIDYIKKTGKERIDISKKIDDMIIDIFRTQNILTKKNKISENERAFRVIQINLQDQLKRASEDKNVLLSQWLQKRIYSFTRA